MSNASEPATAIAAFSSVASTTVAPCGASTSHEPRTLAVKPSMRAVPNVANDNSHCRSDMPSTSNSKPQKFGSTCRNASTVNAVADAAVNAATNERVLHAYANAPSAATRNP